jgi:hypothetical protein
MTYSKIFKAYINNKEQKKLKPGTALPIPGTPAPAIPGTRAIPTSFIFELSKLI